ncbi:uncharacterized protein AB675_6218 [Cyphellophora attinorum]|uniref:Uncharacterized protein n=1 Tax=Cyphellophora attinorum TaxID=1664694 RepID=A0A0N1HYV2_9EURO|nr:uncharacterized protein AB675_6218 [Phialophora attinorum]KPI43760.1 hypothetical protein AB675_6218 [Phialophora attinorum]
MRFHFPLLAAVLTAGTTVLARHIHDEALVDVVSALETQISALEEKIEAATVVPTQVSATTGDAAVASAGDADDSNGANDAGAAGMSVSVPEVASNNTDPADTDAAGYDTDPTSTDVANNDTSPMSTDTASNDTNTTRLDTANENAVPTSIDVASDDVVVPTNTVAASDSSDGSNDSDNNTANDATPPNTLSKRWTVDDRTAQLRCLNSNGGAMGSLPTTSCANVTISPSLPRSARPSVPVGTAASDASHGVAVRIGR